MMRPSRPGKTADIPQTNPLFIATFEGALMEVFSDCLAGPACSGEIFWEACVISGFIVARFYKFTRASALSEFFTDLTPL